jgi:hypothetical protein
MGKSSEFKHAIFTSLMSVEGELPGGSVAARAFRRATLGISDNDKRTSALQP